MPRKNRLTEAGLLRHIVSRGNGRMQIFIDDQFYRKFFWLLGEVVEEYDLECWDVCVMPNHFHVALVNRRPNLSNAMKTLKGEFALWWNAQHNRVGHVFEGRFREQIVQQQTYLESLL